MTTMYGADVEALDALARAFSQAADQLDRVRTSTRGAVYGASWRGARADAFRDQWDSRHATSLRVAATRLRAAGEDLVRQAAQQREASGISSGAVGHGMASSVPALSTFRILTGAAVAAAATPLGRAFKDVITLGLAVPDARVQRLSGLWVRGRTELMLGRHRADPGLIARGSGRMGGAIRWLKPAATKLSILGVAVSTADLVVNYTELGPGDAATWKSGGDVIVSVAPWVAGALAPAAVPYVAAFAVGWTAGEVLNVATERVTGKSVSDRWVDAAIQDDLQRIEQSTDAGLRPGMSKEEIQRRVALQEVAYAEAQVKLNKMQTPLGMTRMLIGLEP